MIGFALCLWLVLAVLLATERADDLQAGDINIYKTEPGEGSAEGGLIPKTLEPRCKCLKIIDIPAFGPGEDGQEGPDLEDKERQ